MKRLLSWLRRLFPRRAYRARIIYGRDARTGLPVVVERRMEERWSWR